VPLRKKKRFLKVWAIRHNGAKEIGLSDQKRFAEGGLQAMMRKRINSFLLKLRYLMLLAEIHVLMGVRTIRRDQDFRRAKP
jgi:hypothetical protein